MISKNVGHAESKSIAETITKICKIFQQILPNFNITLTGLIRRDLHQSKRKNRVMKVNRYLKKICKKEWNIHFLEQDGRLD